MKRITEWRGEHAAIVDNHCNYIDKLAKYEDMEESHAFVPLEPLCKLLSEMHSGITCDTCEEYLGCNSVKGDCDTKEHWQDFLIKWMNFAKQVEGEDKNG